MSKDIDSDSDIILGICPNCGSNILGDYSVITSGIVEVKVCHDCFEEYADDELDQLDQLNEYTQVMLAKRGDNNE